MNRMAFRSTLLLLVTAALAASVLTAMAESKAPQPPYRSPFDVAFSPDGKILAAADRSANAVALIDAGTGKVTRQIPVDGGPADLVFCPTGQRLYVAEHKAGRVAEIDPKTGKIVRRLAVGARPVAVALAPKRKLLFATNSAVHSVSAIDLSNGKNRACIPVLREPRSIAVSPDEKLAVVGNLLPAGSSLDPKTSSAVSLIDLQSLKRTCDIRLPAGSTLVRGIAISPDNRWAYVVHTVGRFNIPTTQLERGWVNTNAMSVIDLPAKKAYATVLLDHPSQGSADPWGVALARDGKTLWISLSGVHKIARIDTAGLHKLLAGDLSGQPRLAKPDQRNPGPQSIWLQIKKDAKQREQLVNELAALHAADLIVNKTIPGNGPRGIDLSPDGKRLAVPMYYSGQIDMIDAATLKPAATVSLGPSRKPDIVRRGEIVFHDATLCFQHWMSCATCHPQGRVDGLNWDLLNDGMGNPKNTRSMLWTDKTPPSMSLGVRANMEVAAMAGFRHILFRQPEPEEIKAAQAYIRSLKPALSPHRTADGGLSDGAKRGKAIFENPKANCASCHPSGLLTDLKLYDVGTRGPLDRADKFDTPTLVELWRTGPYLHDGSAPTLKEVVTKRNKDDKHGVTSQLSAKEIDDLIAYLMSL